MATNEILQFAETDTGTNLLTQAEYLADAQRPIGNQPGVARSKLVNKALRQSSLIASGIAEFLADNQGNNITDSLTPQNIADYMAAVVRSLGIPTAVAGGTADAITAAFTPNVALANGTTVIVRAGAANATTAPTFAPDGLTAKTIVKGNNLALVAGDIAGAGHWLEMNFDATLDKWVLQNPGSGLGRQMSSVQSFNSGFINVGFNNNTVTSMTANVVMPSYSRTGKFRIMGRLTTATIFSTGSGSYIFNSGLLDTTNSNAQLQGDGKSKYQGSGQGTIDTCVFFSPYLYDPGATIPLTVQFSANAVGNLSSQVLTVFVVEA